MRLHADVVVLGKTIWKRNRRMPPGPEEKKKMRNFTSWRNCYHYPQPSLVSWTKPLLSVYPQVISRCDQSFQKVSDTFYFNPSPFYRPLFNLYSFINLPFYAQCIHTPRHHLEFRSARNTLKFLLRLLINWHYYALQLLDNDGLTMRMGVIIKIYTP